MIKRKAWPGVMLILLLGGFLPLDQAGADPGVEGAAAIVRNFSAASAGRALADQSLLGNRVEVLHVMNTDLISGSGIETKGILTVNQASGDVNNQANVYALALVDGESVFLRMSIARSVRLTGNTLITGGGLQENRIESSFGDSVGILGVNQSAGNLNQQANMMVLGGGLSKSPKLAAVGDSDLEAVSAYNTLIPFGPETVHSDVITGSFDGFQGIAQVSQTSGDLNIVGNFLGVSYQAMGVVP